MGLFDPHASNRSIFGVAVPDFGASEWLSNLFNQGRTSQGGSDLFGGTYAQNVTQAPNGSGGYVPTGSAYQPVNKTTNNSTTGGGGQVLGATTGVNNNTGISSTDQMNSVAEQGKTSSIDMIRQRLDEAKRQAQEGRGRAGQYYEEDRGIINSDIDKLLGRAGTRRDESFATLDNTENDIRDQYGRASGSARRRSANAERLNRMRARALNRVDSSFYDDIQAENTNELVRSLGALDKEEAGKISGVGMERVKTENTFTDMFTDIEDNRSKLLTSAKREYDQAISAADALERAGVMDFNEGLAQAENTFQSRLAQIQSFIENQAMRRLELAASVGKFDNSIGSFSNDLSFLNKTDGLNTANNYAGATMANVKGNTGMTMTELLALAQRKPDPDLLYA